MFTQILYRPALAIVISIILLFLGVLGIKTLPVAQFPDIAPPTVEVAIAYPGASANVLVDSVLIPLEQSINGVQGMRYIASSATSAGEAVIRIYFEPGTDPNINVVNVQNRVNIMMNRLPPLVQREGILVSQVVPSMLMYVNIYSEDPNADQKDLFNFANVFVMPRLKRIQGMGIPRNLGNRAFAMRIWLNPDSMRRYNIATDEVMKALAEQSVIGSPGRLGQATGITSQSKEYVLTYVGRYNKKEQYENIILRETAEGEILRLKDICGVKEIKDGKEVQKSPGVELGSEFFDIYSDINGRPAASIILKQSPGSNAAEVIEEIKAELGRIEKESFPPGMKYELSYDVSRFLEASTEKVLHTLIEAFILVSLVVYMFLGDIRSTLIPILAVPVSLIGTFFVLKLMGLSINLITLFAMVLAIGVVVDDAIVVVEAVHAKMAEKHLSPYRATMEVLHEISGAIIAITLVMTSVFVPVTFVPGPVGQFYRQFGITMSTSIVLSGVVALTLTPVLCAMILKPHDHAPGSGHAGHAKKRFSLQTIALYLIGAVLILGPMVYLAYHLWGELGFLLIVLPVVRKPFDRAVEWVTARYAGILRLIVTRRVLTMGVVGGFAAGVVGVNLKLASGFIPGEDQGIIYAVIQTPPGSTLEYTNAKSQNLEAIARDIKEVTSVTSLAGYEVLTEGRGSNAGTCIINLKTWSERERTTREIIEELEAKSRQMTDVKLEFFEPPAVPGFGAAGGFSMRLLDKTNTTDYQRLGEVTEKFMAALEKRKELKNLFTFYTADYPQYELIINNDVAMQKGVSIGKALDNLNILIGSTYEQGFILFNQFYKVYVQSSPEFRRYPEDLDNLFVKSEREVEIKNEKGETRKVRVEGDMVPYSAFMKLEKKQGLNEITRYNLYPSAAIQGAPAAGYSSGQAIKAIQEVAAETLPYGYGIGWEGLSYDESKKGVEVEVPKLLHVEISPSILIFAIVVVFVYLVLVAQYESFLLPLAVILSLPIGIFGSFFCLQALGLSNDVYAQIGLIMLVGLLGKNAILIVEFAVQRRQEGQSLIEAAVEGGKLRFRPIQMTSFAFIAGLLPLVVATGAGAIGNRTIGTTAAGGMLVGTVIGILVIPGLYYLFGRMADGRKLLADEVDGPLSEVFTHHAPELHHNADEHHAPAEHLPFDAGPADGPSHHPDPSDDAGV
ncbi:Efflux pump membrane transporter BepE [Gemmata obscuriglobus]|uniref:Multidrug transporter n=1 Tax=Gemmata obscuriglobus TaxID=114 RepID=A0A2Z3H305_9BACT|nr:efflux RND transporter permease subunit [Gemmata obscuriglobus]AWM37956.1 multidrug transporter [Gemmata obscuriglobus]QEG29186.1 Efflux pump membrane transporter BepE [Gemmata obscuriglobus]VTS07947.1 multidrug transporter : RND efflux system, inner membrane transporter CmeB OS=Sandaracinus amylolyticus GN=DB32_2324 PE=4 SV=1: ACR_tran [Gemmata obscuriglobus UQM 2246]